MFCALMVVMVIVCLLSHEQFCISATGGATVHVQNTAIKVLATGISSLSHRHSHSCSGLSVEFMSYHVSCS